jgi:PKD repeat protein
MSHRFSPLRLVLTAVLAACVGLTLGATSALAATISVSPSSPTSSDDITLTASSSIAAPTGYAWDVDGTARTGNPITVRLAKGTHPVSVAVEGVLGPDNGSTSVTVANSPPDPPTITGPASAVVGQPVTFTASGNDPDGDALQFFWGMPAGCAASGPGQPNQGATMTCTFGAPGQASMSVGSNDGTSASTGSGTKVVQVVAANQLPVASFTFSPGAPRVDQPITLTSTSRDPDGIIASYAWDYDNNGTVDSTSASPTVRFGTPGQHAVKLTVTDSSGTPAEVIQNIPVGQPPAAGFTFSPVAPVAPSIVTFTSISTDPNGFVASVDWDLDGNGVFDDAQGTVVTRAYTTPGTYRISVRATDNEGIASISTQTITVAGPTATPNTPTPNITGTPTPRTPVVAPIRLLNARVAFAGQRQRYGVWLSNLQVTGPRGATVSATCHGKGCPRRIKSFKMGRGGKARVKALERRTLRVGVRIVIRVTRAGAYGKYTRISVYKKHKYANVERKDSCVLGSRIKRCPATT